VSAADLLIVFNADGTFEAVYDDRLLDVLDALGSITVARASHVEPAPAGGWLADMAPVGGPVLLPESEQGSSPGRGFRTRAEALAAERAWLLRERGI
jgi:hypothetical protein